MTGRAWNGVTRGGTGGRGRPEEEVGGGVAPDGGTGGQGSAEQTGGGNTPGEEAFWERRMNKSPAVGEKKKNY